MSGQRRSLSEVRAAYLRYEQLIWGLSSLSEVWEYLRSEELIWGMSSLSEVWAAYLRYEEIICGLMSLSEVWGAYLRYEDIICGLMSLSEVWGAYLRSEGLIWGLRGLSEVCGGLSEVWGAYLRSEKLIWGLRSLSEVWWCDIGLHWHVGALIGSIMRKPHINGTISYKKPTNARLYYSHHFISTVTATRFGISRAYDWYNAFKTWWHTVTHGGGSEGETGEWSG
jgi:hypothetical protein